MFRSKLIVPAVLSACFLGLVPTSLYASPLHLAPTHAFLGSKLVKLSVCNSSAQALQLKIGETAMTIAPGATVPVSAEVGAKIVNVEATSTHAAGEVITEVSKTLSGAILRIS